MSNDVHGVNFAPEAIAFARNRYPVLKTDVMSGFDLRRMFAPDTFDAIVANDMIEHVHDHDAFIDNCRAILRPNGLLLIGTDIEDTPATRHKAIKLFRDSLLPFGWNGMRFIMLRILEAPRGRLRDYHENHVHTVSQRELLALLERHGFQVESHQRYNFLHGAVRDFVLGLVRWVTRLEMRDHQLIVSR